MKVWKKDYYRKGMGREIGEKRARKSIRRVDKLKVCYMNI
jgi:hypothetical protein